MNEPPHVELRGVRKTYDGEHLVVRDLDLAIRRGEFLTLLGPSGSGKTTILMMLAGFETPTAGDIVLAGRSIADLPPHKRDIGVVFQHYALFPHMTVAENVGFPLSVRKIDRREAERRVAEALDMVQLGDLGARRPGQLSGGQRQRVALARALVFEPQLVLMDEPLGALDKQLREHMQLEIKHLHARLGVTVVYVTHDQSEALTMSDRVAVFDAGVVQQVDTPEALYEAPRNAFVARFIGENNRLTGTLTRREGDRCVVALAEGQVHALAVNVGEVGEPASVSVRPERVRLGDGRADNRFTGTVVERVYHGDHAQIRLRVAGHDDFVVKRVNDGTTARWTVGDAVEVGWDVADARALDVLEADR